MGFIILAIILVAVGVCYKSGKLDKFLKKSQPPIVVAPTIKKLTKLTGTISAPTHEERLRAYDESRARGETNEGGGVDHGFYLEGSFDISVDENNNLSGNLVIYGDSQVTGGHLNSDGTFSGMHLGGPFEGKVIDNKITGMVFEGGGREYLHINAKEEDKVPFIFGRFEGTAT